MRLETKPNALMRQIHEIVQRATTKPVVLAGGALRDGFTGRDHKDVDVFVESRRDTGGFERTLMDLQATLGPPVRYLCHVEYLQWQHEVTGFANYNILGQDVQIVGIDYRPLTTMRAISRMDLGFCQIGWDGENLECTPEFLEDVKNETMTMVRCTQPADVARTRARIERFTTGKYRGWIGVMHASPDSAFSGRWLTMTDEELKEEQHKYEWLFR